MRAVPADTPVTRPALTFATAVLLLLQVPPDEVSVNVDVAPIHAFGVPLMVPALGAGRTVTDGDVIAVMLVQPVPGYVADRL